MDCPAGLKFRGERQDLEEMVGNLMDNAFKWAASAITVKAEAVTDTGRTWIELTVGDDGPGLPEERRQEALQRGSRLDETKPGSGLGLNIVKETAAMYGGRFRLDQSSAGGLAAILRLPAA
jgi:signal transduction histidine kinase